MPAAPDPPTSPSTPARCARCGIELRRSARFCDSCGAPVPEEARAPALDLRRFTPAGLAERIVAGAREQEGERKHVTVLFADVRGSMELSEHVDAEAWHSLLDRFFSILCAGIQRFDGTVSKFTGDGVMALFGAPIAEEDHARRAAHAALHLLDELERYAAELEREHGLDFRVRIGLNSGEVVLGTIGADLNVEYTAVGHSVGLAQRMEALAAPGTAYLTERTAALVSGYFALEEVGPQEVKGVHGPVRVYRLVGTGPARTALDVARARGLSRFVGREPELSELERALERALAGEGEVLGVVAEAGLGKSRLVFEFTDACRSRGVAVFRGHALPHGSAVSLLPIRELLRAYFGISDRDPDETARERIARTLQALDDDFGEELELVFGFLGVADPAAEPPRIDPEARQRRLLAMLRRLVAAQARQAPTVFVLEDLHWLDPGSEAFFDALAAGAADTRSLVLTTMRPDYAARFAEREERRAVVLDPLGAEAIEDLLGHLLGDDPSLERLFGLIRDRAEGNPFYVEEVVRALAEDGRIAGARGAYTLSGPTEEPAIPESVQAVLAARVDRLGETEKAVLQTAAVVGKRDFPSAVLARVAGLDENELEEVLEALVATGFIDRDPDTPEPQYVFKHPLTQEVAYASQLSRRRARIHAATAGVIQELYPERLDERAALVAHHLEQAGELLDGAHWHARAASRAGINDQRVALEHWSRVRDLTTQVPESPESLRLGRAARVWLLDLGWRTGMPVEEAERVFEEGRQLAERADAAATLPYLLLPYGMIRAQRGHLDEFLELRAEAQRIADESGAVGDRLSVRAGLMYASLLTGRLAEALAASEEALELVGEDPGLGVGAGVRSFSALAFFAQFHGFLLGLTGRLDEGALELGRGLEVAREREDLELVAWGRILEVWSARYSGEVEGVVDAAREGVETAERIGGPFTQAAAQLALGTAELLSGRWGEARTALERSLEIGREGAGGEYAAWALAYLAEADLGAGEHEAGLRRAERAVSLAAEGSLPLFELQAQLTLARVLLAAEGAAALPAIERALDRALILVGETGAASADPLIRVERARVANHVGDSDRASEELDTARRLFEAIGAHGHLARNDSAVTAP